MGCGSEVEVGEEIFSSFSISLNALNVLCAEMSFLCSDSTPTPPRGPLRVECHHTDVVQSVSTRRQVLRTPLS